MPIVFQELKIANWRQFRELEIQFHNRLTVLTGANGAGKTTVLNVLTREWVAAMNQFAVLYGDRFTRPEAGINPPRTQKIGQILERGSHLIYRRCSN